MEWHHKPVKTKIFVFLKDRIGIRPYFQNSSCGLNEQNSGGSLIMGCMIL